MRPGRTTTSFSQAAELFLSWFFVVAAELKTHGRQKLVRKLSFATRAESLIQRRSEHGRWHGFVDRSLDRPPSFAGVRDSACKGGGDAGVRPGSVRGGP